MTEAELQAVVMAECARLGIWCFHDHSPKRNMPGWPDLVMWSRGGIIARELKSDQGRLSKEQQLVIATMQRAGLDCRVWRPEDWETGRIHRELLKLARVRSGTKWIPMQKGPTQR